MKLLKLTAVYIFLTFLLACGRSYAAVSRPSGVGISPAIEQLTLSKNQNGDSFPVTITNNTDCAVSIAISAHDFSSLNQTGALNFGYDQSGSAQNHQLASSLQPAQTKLVVGPNQSVTDQVRVLNVRQLAAGGHYAALIYKVNAQPLKDSNVVQIQEAISTLVFVSTSGEGTQQLRIMPPIARSFYTSLPQSLEAVFANNGNTQSTLRGTVQVYDGSSGLVSKGVMNINSDIILPGSQRLFTISLDPIPAPKHWFGRYTVKVTYGHDAQSIFSVYTTSFYYVSASIAATLLILVLLAVAAASFVVRGLIRRRRSNRFVRVK